MVTCNRCGTMFTRKGNLKRHQKDRCKGISRVEGDPQISDIINAVINNGIAAKPKYIDFAPPPSKKQKMSPSVNLLSLEFGDDASESDSDYDSDTDSDHDSTNAVDKIKYNINDLPVINDDNVDVDDLPPPNKIKFLPETVAGLRNRFNTLFPKYWKNKQHEYHNELVYLLDELLRQNGITRTLYRKMNGLLSIGDGIEQAEHEEEQQHEQEEGEEEEEGEGDGENMLEDKITDTVDYLIKHDRAEIEKLLTGFEKEQTVLDDVAMLRKLMELYIRDKLLGKEVTQSKDIDQILSKLKESAIPRSKLLRVGMILKAIKRNRHRVSDILQRMVLILSDDQVSTEEISRALKNLIQEELINEEQFKQLTEMKDTLNIDKVISVIKTTKIGRGVNFLPRETKDLQHKLQVWSNAYQEEATSDLKQKIVSVLDELLFRRVISKQDFKDIIEHLE